MEQTVSVSVDALTQAFSAAFRQEFQPLKQELQTLAANSTSQHLDNGTALEPELTRRNQYTMSSKQQFRVTLPDGRKVFATGDTVDGAFSSFAKKYGRLYQQEEPMQEKKECPTLKEFTKSVYRPSFMANLKPTTRRSYEYVLKAYVMPFLGDMRMDEITVAVIQDFYNKLASAQEYGYQKNLNAKTIERIRGLVSRIYSVAVEMKVVDETPFKNHLLKIRAERGAHHKALPDEEIDRVKREIPLLEDDEIRLYFAVLAYTGMRREEIMGLRWENIDLEKGVAYVRCTVTYPGCNKAVVQDDAKTEHSIRPVILPVPLVQILKPMQKESGYLYGGEEPWCYSRFSRRYEEGKRLLRIERFNNHDFRTTYGTQLKESGMSSALVADMMGHADTRMVETVYARTREEGILKQRAYLNELNEKYAKQN